MDANPNQMLFLGGKFMCAEEAIIYKTARGERLDWIASWHPEVGRLFSTNTQDWFRGPDGRGMTPEAQLEWLRSTGCREIYKLWWNRRIRILMTDEEKGSLKQQIDHLIRTDTARA